MAKKHLMLMGIQGSGKGTQAALITKNFGYVSLETGALLRAVLENPNHKHYQAVADTVPHGKLTPDPVIFDLIQEFFDTHPNDRILVDGAVRRIAQREFFDKITTDYIVIHITLTEEEALRRLQGRKMDPVTKEIFGADFEGIVSPTTGNELVIRVDDQDVEKIQKRFEWYRSDIVPLLDSWKADGVEFYTVNGEQSREAVWSEIENILAADNKITATPSKNISISKSTIKKILLALFILILLAGASIGAVVFKGYKEKAVAEEKVTELLQFMTDKDYEKAYTLTAGEFQENTSLEKLESLANTDTGRALFTDFQSVSFDSYKVSAGTQYGTYYEYSGPITYTNEDTGTILVRLVKEDGVFKVLYFNVKVSPERVQEFQDKE